MKRVSPEAEEQRKDEQRLQASLATLKEQFCEFTSSVANEKSEKLPRLFYVDREARAHATQKIEFFVKKDDARDYARANGNLPMWSVDKFSGTGEKSGAKYFVVASYDEFYALYERCKRPTYGGQDFAPDEGWKRYDSIKSTEGLSRDEAEKLKRECLEGVLKVYPFAYEVIMEGVPLHLYLDMEGSRVTNAGVDFEALAGEILEELRKFMCCMHIGPRKALLRPDLVILDSSTGTKFSKHVVYKIPGCLFENNYVCGALMRNFHLHLIGRFGEPESNRFYVNPPDDAKSKTKICILDFAVYTKFRDFRLIGSCKRKGCSSSANPLRYLWMQQKRGKLTKKLFLECLIQNTEPPQQILGSTIVDTINGGIPYSSSLRTAQPLNPTATTTASGATIIAKAPLSDFSVSVALQLPSQVRKRLEELGARVGQYLSSVRKDPWLQYFREGAKVTKTTLRTLRDGNYAWSIETTCRYCLIRQAKIGDPRHKPGGRTSTFLVWATGLCKNGSYDESKVGVMKQMCIANSCTGGLGPSKPAWSGYIGEGLPEELRKMINDLLRPCIESEVARLGLWSVQSEAERQPKKSKDDDDDDICLFDEDE